MAVSQDLRKKFGKGKKKKKQDRQWSRLKNICING